MKWIGQHIWDFISRFRNDVYLEDISTGTIASGGNLGLDSNNKIVKASEVGSDVDLTSEVTGVLPVANGGSGASSLTSNRVLTGNGTSPIQAESGLYFENPSLLIGSDNDSESIIGKWAHGDGDGGTLKIQGANATFGQTDKNGGDIYISAGRPTGSGAFGEIQFYGGDVEGTGTSLRTNSLISRLHSNAAVSTDFYLYEKAGASTDDYLRIGTAEHGATTIATIDGGGSNANLQITADGTAELAGTTVTLDSAGAITFERGSSTVEVPNVAGTLQVVDLVQYLLPSDFIVNDASFVRGYSYAADDNGPSYGGTWQDGGIEAWAWYQIPKGFKVTHMHARGSVTSSTDASIYQLDPEDGTRSSALASGAWGIDRALSSAIESADDKVALVVLNPNAATDIIFSVKLTLALV